MPPRGRGAVASAALAVQVARGPRRAKVSKPRPQAEPELQREGIRTLTLLQRQMRLEALAAALGPVTAPNRAARRAAERRARKRQG